MSPASVLEDRGSIPGPAQWVKDLDRCGLWCRSQMQVGSGVAGAVGWAGSCSSSSTPNLGAFICLRFSAKKTKRKRSSTVAQWGKDRALSLLWCRFDPWPGNFLTPSEWPEEFALHIQVCEKKGRCVMHVVVDEV